MVAWKRKQMHSHVYRVPEPFQDQVVVVVGNSLSGQDISMELVNVAKEIYLSAKSPCVQRDYQKSSPNTLIYIFMQSSILVIGDCLRLPPVTHDSVSTLPFFRVQQLDIRYKTKTKILRDGKWNEEDAGILVPGDIISIKLGDIIPADARLLDGDPLKIDQSALTGASLPVTKGSGDGIYSGSTCKQGEIEAVVIATGVHTFFGKAAYLVDTTNQVGHFQKASSYS